MIKDVYLFTNGTLLVFDELGQQLPELQGMFTDEKKFAIEKQFYDGTRITLARGKKGFFELTRAEFMRATLVGLELKVAFLMSVEKSTDA